MGDRQWEKFLFQQLHQEARGRLGNMCVLWGWQGGRGTRSDTSLTLSPFPFPPTPSPSMSEGE